MDPSATAAHPKYLKASYLAPQESLLKETRATKLYYFPGPIVLLLIFLGLDYLAESVRSSSLPAVPWLTGHLGMLPTINAYAPGTYLLVFFLFLTILGLLWLLVRYLRWITTVYAVSSARVIVQRGILSRDFDEIPISQVRGVDVHQSFFQRMLGYGTIRVSSEGGSSVGNEDWRGIPKPFQFQRLVESASQTQRSGVPWGGSPPTAAAPPGPGYLRPPGQM